MTNALSILPQFDQIVVMNGGRVREVGTYAELMDANGAFAEFIRTYASVDENEEGNQMFFKVLRVFFNACTVHSTCNNAVG